MAADGVLAASALFANANSNDAKMRLLERRLRGDTPSPRNVSRGSSAGQVSVPGMSQRWKYFYHRSNRRFLRQAFVCGYKHYISHPCQV